MCTIAGSQNQRHAAATSFPLTCHVSATIIALLGLCFDLVLSPSLRACNGMAVLGTFGGVPTRWRFDTEPWRMYMAGVSSRRASELTSGRWTSSGSGGSGAAAEAPPDAEVRLSFSCDIDHALALAALRSANAVLLGSADANDATIKCGKRCLLVRPRGLQSGQTYPLVLPAGSRYSDLAGPLSEEQAISLMGLLTFSFPFWFETPPQEEWRNR